MTEKTKRIILIAAGVLLCAALVVGIVSRLAAVPMHIDPAIPDDTPNTKDPVVNISDPEVKVHAWFIHVFASLDLDFTDQFSFCVEFCCHALILIIHIW